MVTVSDAADHCIREAHEQVAKYPGIETFEEVLDSILEDERAKLSIDGSGPSCEKEAFVDQVEVAINLRLARTGGLI